MSETNTSCPKCGGMITVSEVFCYKSDNGCYLKQVVAICPDCGFNVDFDEKPTDDDMREVVRLAKILKGIA